MLTLLFTNGKSNYTAPPPPPPNFAQFHTLPYSVSQLEGRELVVDSVEWGSSRPGQDGHSNTPQRPAPISGFDEG